MQLDYNPAKQTFILRVPRTSAAQINELMRDHGLDFSTSASTASTAVLFTREPYAAVAFGGHATETAARVLAPLSREIDASFQKESSAHIKVPADCELWPFQRASVEYALRRTNTLVGDQPGLGKTPIAIAFANEIAAKRILVICPANIRLQWVKKIHIWSTLPWPRVVHPILHGRHGVHPRAHWTVVSYDLARTPGILKQLCEGTYDLLILDEAHYLKTSDAGRTRAIFGGGPIEKAISSRCGATLALTGTPLPNRPREAYTLSRALCWDAIDWMSEDKFAERFNPSARIETRGRDGKTKFFIDERSGREHELQARLRANFMVRHMKRDVMTQLQMPVFDLIQLKETRAVKAALEAERLLDIDPETLAGADATVLGHIAVVRRQMGIALAPPVADYIDMLVDGGEEKLVVFGWHIEVLNILQERWAKHGVLRIDGSTSASRKQRIVETFISDPKAQIMLGNIQSMGTGTDGLQLVSNHALIAEPSWTPGENEQCFDRLDRGGQTRQVQGDIFVAPGSIAEKILASALRKGQTTHRALDARL